MDFLCSDHENIYPTQFMALVVNLKYLFVQLGLHGNKASNLVAQSPKLLPQIYT